LIKKDYILSNNIFVMDLCTEDLNYQIILNLLYIFFNLCSYLWLYSW